MVEAQSLKFVLRGADGVTRELVVDSDSALIGSGAHCEIRLAPEDAAVEQLKVEARAGGVFAEARSLNPPTLLNGVPFAQGRLLPDSALRIGAVELCVSSSAAGAPSNDGRKRTERSGNPVIYALGAIGFPLGFYILFATRSAPAALPAPVPPPPLWSSAAVACPERDAAAARARAERDAVQADAARERAPFRPEDGVAAVEAYQRASACFAVAGDPSSARAAEAASSLKRKVGDDFHIHQVRLERALATKRYDQARTELRLLLSFVGRRGGEYASWLSTLDRQLELKFSGKKR